MNRRVRVELSTSDEQTLRQVQRPGMNAAASATMVNRTHRVVRERAKNMQAQRSRIRSLSIPLAVSGGMLAVIVSAIWSILEQDELIPTGLPDANQQMLVLMMWCLPVSVLLLAVVLYRRNNSARDFGMHDNGARGDNGRAG